MISATSPKVQPCAEKGALLCFHCQQQHLLYFQKKFQILRVALIIKKSNDLDNLIVIPFLTIKVLPAEPQRLNGHLKETIDSHTKKKIHRLRSISTFASL